MDKKVIIFDFDGVIVDSYSIYFEVHKLARPALTKESFEQIWSRNIFQAKFKEKKIREVDFRKEIDQRYPTLMLDPEISKEIKRLSHDFNLFIVSSTWSETIRKFLRRYKFEDFFLDILGAEAGTSKVEKITRLCLDYSINPSDAYFITDTGGDIHEAKKARIGCVIAILGGFQSLKILKKAEPNIIVRNFAELAKFFRS